MELRKWKALNQERTLQQQRAKLIVQQEFGTSAQPRRVPMSANSECCFPLAAFASSAEAQVTARLQLARGMGAREVAFGSKSVHPLLKVFQD